MSYDLALSDKSIWMLMSVWNIIILSELWYKWVFFLGGGVYKDSFESLLKIIDGLKRLYVDVKFM